MIASEPGLIPVEEALSCQQPASISSRLLIDINVEIVEREPIRPPKGSAMIQTPQIGDSIDQYFAPSTSGHCWTILRWARCSLYGIRLVQAVEFIKLYNQCPLIVV
jgi:hypothetical protein